jgi:hypothetical protein
MELVLQRSVRAQDFFRNARRTEAGRSEAYWKYVSKARFGATQQFGKKTSSGM